MVRDRKHLGGLWWGQQSQSLEGNSGRPMGMHQRRESRQGIDAWPTVKIPVCLLISTLTLAMFPLIWFTI